jgi:hypothetical protein
MLLVVCGTVRKHILNPGRSTTASYCFTGAKIFHLPSPDATEVLTYRQNDVISKHLLSARSRDSSVGIATGYGLDDRGIGVDSRWAQEFSILHVVQTGFATHPASYPVGTGGSFAGGKAAGALSRPFTSNKSRGRENMDLNIHSHIRLHGVVLN